jgi:acetylornithine deacetylase/succinyl-diaminopimelate desuccinylase-like protein
MVEQLLAHLDDAYTLRVLKEMIRIPSVVGQEQELAEYLRGELEALGLECEMQEVEPGRPNVYARLEGDGPGKRLNFCGHTDTVPVAEGWDSDPFTPLEIDGRLHGLGACDMKAGIACALTTLQAFVASGYRFRGKLSFAGVIDEEAYGAGARAMLESDYGKVDAIVLAEPYPGDETKPIPLGITGKVLYDVHVKGKAAHGFRPHLGVNAVEEAAKIIANLRGLRFRRHPDFGEGNTCTLKIEGGYQVYSVVVPSQCRFEVNRLLVPGESAETAIEDMERLVASLHLTAEVEIEPNGLSTRPMRWTEASRSSRSLTRSTRRSRAWPRVTNTPAASPMPTCLLVRAVSPACIWGRNGAAPIKRTNTSRWIGYRRSQRCTRSSLRATWR